VKRYASLFVLIVAGFGGLSGAHGGVILSYIPIYISTGPSSWTVRGSNPYAIWDAKSQIAPATEISFEGRDRVVDSAPLVPHALYASDQDLIDGNRIWLPKGGLLVKMAGGAGNWFCTWRFDERSNQSQAEAANERLEKIEHLLCLQADSNGKTTNSKIMIAHLKGLLTVSDPDSGMGKYRNGVGETNAVTLAPVSNDALPGRAQLQITAKWTSSNGGTVCFHAGLTDMKGRELFTQNDQCIAGAGQSINIAGGTYTITAIGERNTFKIRIDHPIDAQGIGPRVVG